MSPVNREDYDDVVGKINRKYENSMKMGDQIENPSRISTGSLELDVAMGGGIPVGRWSRFYGSYSSTKTLNTLNVVREAQELGMACAYYNIEKQYDPVFSKNKIGVDTSKLTIVEGTTIEEIGDKMESLFGVIDLHIVDSCTQAVSEDELNADIRDWRPGISARAWGKAIRRLNERFDHFENTVILVDQARTNFKTGGEDAPGGRILDFTSSMTVHFKKGGWLFKNDHGYLDEKAKQKKDNHGQVLPEGIEIKARVEKSRVGRPLLSATMRLDLNTLEFDRVFEIMKAAKHYGVLRQAGRFTYYERDGQDDVRFDSEAELREWIRSDITFQEEVKETVMTRVGER